MVKLITELNQIRLKIQDAKHQKELQTILNNPLKRNASVNKNKDASSTNNNNNLNYKDNDNKLILPQNDIQIINSNSEIIDLDCVEDDNQLNN